MLNRKMIHPNYAIEQKLAALISSLHNRYNVNLKMAYLNNLTIRLLNREQIYTTL